MFHSSTQRRHWTFGSEEELARSRAEANRKFRSRVAANGKVRGGVEGEKAAAGLWGCEGKGAPPPPSRPPSAMSHPRVPSQVVPSELCLLDPQEELAICKYYEKRLLDFCAVFKPAMPRSVVVSRRRGPRRPAGSPQHGCPAVTPFPCRHRGVEANPELSRDTIDDTNVSVNWN